jgi:hypothetical protein
MGHAVRGTSQIDGLGKLMLRWVDGFEQYGLTETHLVEGVGGGAAWSSTDNWLLSTANPATGAGHMRVAAQSNFPQLMRRALGQSSQVCGFGYRFSLADLPDTEGSAYMTLGEFADVGNTTQINVRIGTEGSVRALGAGVDERSDPCIAAGGYHHYEAKAKIDNSVGYIEVRINEVTVVNVTGADTQASANAESSQIRFGMHPVVTDTVSTTMDVDDVFAWDDDASDAENTVVDWVGDKGCYYLPVNADTATADWLKSSGVTGYQLIDELDPIDSDYVYDSSGVARSIFGVAALPGNVAEVIAMMPVLRARKEESGSVTLRAGVVVGTDESYTPDNSPSTQFAYMTPGCKTIDPSTGVAWANDADPELLIERTV